MGHVFGTQIRHACPQPSAIRGLVLPVVRAPFVALLVSALRVRHDDLARLVTAPAGAIFLAPIARPTDRQELLAAGAREEPVIEHDLERADFLPWLSFSGEAASRRRDLARQGRPGVAAPGLRPIGRVPFPRNPPPSGLRNFRRSICRPQITRIGVAGHPLSTSDPSEVLIDAVHPMPSRTPTRSSSTAGRAMCSSPRSRHACTRAPAERSRTSRRRCRPLDELLQRRPHLGMCDLVRPFAGAASSIAID